MCLCVLKGLCKVVLLSRESERERVCKVVLLAHFSLSISVEISGTLLTFPFDMIQNGNIGEYSFCVFRLLNLLSGYNTKN